MYKLVIVDDEDTIRNGLVDLIPWEEIGFSVEAAFEDGQEAIDYLQRNGTDVILTDIIMAQVSGIELAKYVYHRKPAVKVVLISGYKEFEYAQQAIQYNVNHYLLKPTKLEEIIGVFSQIKQELDRAVASEAERRRSQEWQFILQEHFFADLLTGQLQDAQEIERRMEIIQLPFSSACSCCVIAVQLKPDIVVGSAYSEEKRKAELNARKLFKSITHQDVRYFPICQRSIGFKVIAMFAEGTDAHTGMHRVRKHLRSIAESMEKIFSMQIEMEIESAYNHLEELGALNSPVVEPSAEVESTLRFPSTLIERAIDYIQDHFHQDLSLEIVADHIFLHPVYFSKLFKQYAGINFTEYLTKLRIHRAQELLAEQKYKMYEIGQRVGYSNSKYFYRVFKQVTGLTPKEYFRIHHGTKAERNER